MGFIADQSVDELGKVMQGLENALAVSQRGEEGQPYPVLVAKELALEFKKISVVL